MAVHLRQAGGVAGRRGVGLARGGPRGGVHGSPPVVRGGRLLGQAAQPRSLLSTTSSSRRPAIRWHTVRPGTRACRWGCPLPWLRR